MDKSIKVSITINDLERVLAYFKVVTKKIIGAYKFHWKLVEDDWTTDSIEYFIKKIHEVRDPIYLSYISMFFEQVPFYVQALFHDRNLIIDAETSQIQADLLKIWQHSGS